MSQLGAINAGGAQVSVAWNDEQLRRGLAEAQKSMQQFARTGEQAFGGDVRMAVRFLGVIGNMRIAVDALRIATQAMSGNWEDVVEVVERLPFGLGPLAQSINALLRDVTGVNAAFREAEAVERYVQAVGKLNEVGKAAADSLREVARAAREGAQVEAAPAETQELLRGRLATAKAIADVNEKSAAAQRKVVEEFRKAAADPAGAVKQAEEVRDRASDKLLKVWDVRKRDRLSRELQKAKQAVADAREPLETNRDLQIKRITDERQSAIAAIVERQRASEQRRMFQQAQRYRDQFLDRDGSAAALRAEDTQRMAARLEQGIAADIADAAAKQQEAERAARNEEDMLRAQEAIADQNAEQQRRNAQLAARAQASELEAQGKTFEARRVLIAQSYDDQIAQAQDAAEKELLARLKTLDLEAVAREERLQAEEDRRRAMLEQTANLRTAARGTFSPAALQSLAPGFADVAGKQLDAIKTIGEQQREILRRIESNTSSGGTFG